MAAKLPCPPPHLCVSQTLIVLCGEQEQRHCVTPCVTPCVTTSLLTSPYSSQHGLMIFEILQLELNSLVSFSILI